MSDEDLSAIDSKEAMKEFFLEVKERAKQFPRNTIENYNPNVAVACKSEFSKKITKIAREMVNFSL